MKKSFTVCIVILTLVTSRVSSFSFKEKPLKINDITVIDRITFIKQKLTEINSQLKTYKKTDKDIWEKVRKEEAFQNIMMEHQLKRYRKPFMAKWENQLKNFITTMAN